MSVLATLLTDSEVYGPEYGGGLCNHLPMALTALDQLGATPDQLSAYCRTHVSWLEKLPAGNIDGLGAWPFRKADRAAFLDLEADFRRCIARDGREKVLRAALPELAPGVSAAAFHGLIRTAMGVVSRHDGEIAAGLAYWAAHWQRLGVVFSAPVDQAGSRDPLALLERLRNDPRFAFDPKQAPGLIDDAMLAVGALRGFEDVVHWLDPARDIAEIARAAGILYSATGDFTALHTVTGTQAVVMLLPFVKEPKAILPWLWQGLAAAYIVIGRPAIPHTDVVEAWRSADTPSWQDLLQEAVRQDDEHTVKLCYAALSLGRLTGDPLFRWLVAREVGALNEAALPAWRQ